MAFVVVIPDQAFILDWVFADGPPQRAKVYDNNGLQDFHAIVPQGIPDELYWVEEELKIYQKLQEERRLRQEAIRAKVNSFVINEPNSALLYSVSDSCMLH